jgi:hypothetical protein
MERPGLDELMIVNPGAPATTEALCLKESGMVRRLHGPCCCSAPRRREQLFLCSDGIVYQVGEPGPGSLGRHFLGADGTVYEVDR